MTSADEAVGAPAPPPLHYRLARTLEGHGGSVASVKFSPDGQWCVMAARMQRAARLA
jgi:WD40 repeat protein